MVRTGGRAQALQQLLLQIGIAPDGAGPPVPRLSHLPAATSDAILDLFRALGGTANEPRLRPGSWDLVCTGGLVIELDEELHFNRYRRLTLEPAWAQPLPWREAYLAIATDQEPACLAAAKWGQRWTSPGSEALFGPPDPPGHFSTGGAPRWKQRALYDAMKDAAALATEQIRLVRLATHDQVAGVSLGAALRGQRAIDLDGLAQLVSDRSI